jgi:UPF0755 protein
MTGNLEKRLKWLFRFRKLKLIPLKYKLLTLPHFRINALNFRQFRFKHWIILSGLILMISLIVLSYNIYNKIYQPNVEQTTTIFISTGSDYQKVLSILKDKNILFDVKSFNWVAKRKMYPSLVRPGAYKIEKGWNNNVLVDRLRSGIQTPVNVTFNNIRLRENLAGVLPHYLEPDSASFLAVLNNDSLANQYGFTHENFTCLFIPNTYEFYWTTTPLKFIARMKREYDLFWNESRRNKAALLSLSPPQVMTLASIIQEETNKNDEKSRISGVYINRLQKGWLLQADPTIRYAMRDFSVKRILTDYLKIDSPYNTYKYSGLPPGPINFPDISSIDAVLNSEKHDYLYFCAKDDFSGYHNFAKTLYEHNINAAKYQRALNNLKIWK